MTYGYKILDDGTMVPYPIDTQLAYETREKILCFDEDRVIFRMPHIEEYYKSVFAIFQRSKHNDKYLYELCRMNENEGWVVVYGDEYKDTNEAMAYLIPMAKYYV